MPDENFWKERFDNYGEHSVGPGDTETETALDEHKQYFVNGIRSWLTNVKGPVLDFGCGVGRWVNDLPRPYLGLDLLQDHLDICATKYSAQPDVDFKLSSSLDKLPQKYYKTIFTCTVLQHIVEKDARHNILNEFQRLLSDDGIFLSVEWAEDQRQYDWCAAVTKKELRRWFHTKNVGQVIESGRKHNIWICTPIRPSRLSQFFIDPFHNG